MSYYLKIAIISQVTPWLWIFKRVTSFTFNIFSTIWSLNRFIGIYCTSIKNQRLNTLIEIRNDLIKTAAERKAWAEIITKNLIQAKEYLNG